MQHKERYISRSNKFANSFTYDLLADKETSEQLSYVQCSQPLRSRFAVAWTPEQTLESFDKVRIAIDFAYLDEV